MLAFPTTAVRITKSGDRHATIADPTVAICYNSGDSYVAEQLQDDTPERTAFIAIDPAWLIECVREVDPRVDDIPARPLRFTDVPLDRRSFAGMRAMVQSLARSDAIERLAAHEAVAEVVRRVVHHAYAARSIRRPGAARELSTARHRRAAQVAAARELLARRFRESLGLPEIAAAVGTSPYHLSRIFRDRVGWSLHEYRTELRLREAVVLLCDVAHPRALAPLALELGFSSQSHFTSAFSTWFGCSPAAFRTRARRGRVGAAELFRASTKLKDC